MIPTRSIARFVPVLFVLLVMPAAAQIPAPVCTVRETAHPEGQIELPAAQTTAALNAQVETHLTRAHTGWRADTRVVSATPGDREMTLGFVVALPKDFTRVFCTDMTGDRDTGTSGQVLYRSQCAVPAITFYSHRRGITFIVPFELQTPGLVFRWEQTTAGLKVTAEITNLRLGADRPCRAVLMAVKHEGDWRPGLGWIVQHYPEYFYPPNPKVVNYDGPMIYDFITPEQRLRRDLGQDLAWQELGWSWPHLGLYLPDAESWQRQSRADGGLGVGGTVTRKMLTDFIHLATGLGVGEFLYFQSTESWADYAAQHFASSRARRANGDLCPTWIKCVCMNPDPAYPFGRHIAQQATAMMDAFPQMAGFFWDQNAYSFFDFAHDDGISMADGRRVSMMEFAQQRLQGPLTHVIHARGKSIFSNGACTVGLARYCDGVMSEGMGWTRRLQYICMMKPLTLLAYDSNLTTEREKVELALETGAQPSVTLGNDACRAFFQGYRPMFRLLRGKQWVFTAHALQLPEHWRGNIFRNPAGNYVVTLVPPRTGVAAADRLRSATVKVRLPHENRDPLVPYLLTPELHGFRRVPMQRDGDAYTIQVPALATCGELLLARRGVWLAATQSVQIQDVGKSPQLEVANLRPQPLNGDISITTPTRMQTFRLHVRPYQCQRFNAAFAATGKEKLSLRTEWREQDGGRGEEIVEVPTVPAVDLDLGNDSGAAQLLRGETIEGAVANRADADVRVTIATQWLPGAAPVPPQTIRLAPHEVHRLSIPVTLPHGGSWTLHVTARWSGGAIEAQRTVDVLDSFLPAGFRPADAAGMTLRLDAFNSLGGQWADKEVTLNGVAIGKLPVTGQTLRWNEGMAMKIPAAAVRQILAAGVQPDGSYRLAVVVANTVHNCFKVRNVQASLQLSSGATVLSTWSREVRCSDSGWLYTEGKSVSNGQPVPAGEVVFRTLATGG